MVLADSDGKGASVATESAAEVPVYEEYGAGPNVVLSHGTLMDRTMFEPQVAALAPDYHVVTYDHRARTSRWDEVYDLHDLARDCLALLDRLEIERCVLGGMSMGGFMALEF